MYYILYKRQRLGKFANTKEETARLPSLQLYSRFEVCPLLGLSLMMYSYNLSVKRLSHCD